MIKKLRLPESKSTWSDYYDEAAQRKDYLEHKEKIIGKWLGKIKPESVADFGANTGEFSKLAATQNIKVIATDFDAFCINTLYKEIKKNSEKNILPLVLDLSKPSPAIGVNNDERDSFIHRTQVDLALALALVHHLAIGKNISLGKIADFFKPVCNYLIIEFVPKTDEKIQLMLRNKEDIYSQYTEENFRIQFQNHFNIQEKIMIAGSERTLYLMKKMKDKFLHILRTKPIFLFLLPPFFVLHGFMENYNFIPVGDALLLTGVYTGASIMFSLLCWLLYRNYSKANLVAFCIMAFNFFFGSVHDALKKIFSESFITKYIFILPAALVLFIVLLVVIKKRKRPLLKLTNYLNVLLIILLLADTVLLTGKIINKKSNSYSLPAGFKACESCPKPDIYFILADEYAGNNELKDLFHFDDSIFLSQLAALNFHTIPHSSSNYNYTPFSVASILNMNYLDLKGKERARPDLTYSYQSIRDNQLLQFLRANNYDFFNYSVFDFEGQPARVRETFLPVKTRLITAQTFLHRFDKEIRFNLVSRWKSKKNLEILTYTNRDNNKNIYNLTWKLAQKTTTKPRFVYTHLMMPHYPYYYDKNGKEQPFETLLESNQVNKEAYIEYVQYTNKKLLALIDHLLKSSSTPPIIVLMGDHGFRHFEEPVESKYYFLNLASVHLPSNNYSAFSDSLTGVNFFRTILNSAFDQRLPYLKDSTIYLKD